MSGQSGVALRIFSAVAVAVLVAALAVVVGRLARKPANAPADEPLALFCGAGVRPVMEDLAAAYARRTGAGVRMNYGASNLLLGQLSLATGQADLFLPGDAFYVEQARAAGLVVEETPVAWFIPSILVQPGNPHGLNGLPDLARPGLRLALGDPRSAAIGRIMPALLALNGLAEDAFASNAAYTATTAPELANAVRLGHVDATVVWEAVARLYEPCVVVPIPADRNWRVPLSVGLLADAPQPAAARRFMAFLRSAEAGSIWRAHFYETDEAEEP